MDRINITSNGQSISFSTKSLTINDVEYPYSGIKAIKHSSARHLYLFKYEDAWHNLYYNEEDQKKISAIFSRVAAMNARRTQAEKQDVNAATQEPEETRKPAEADKPEEAEGVQNEPAPASDPEGTHTGEPETKDSGDDNADVGENLTDTPETDESDSTVNTVADKADTEESTEEETSENTDEDKSLEKKAKLKKSIIVFIIIIALFVAAGVAYFFVLGPANDSSQGTSTDSTHQYDDIEELIDEMQE